jgi:hypothetical protein
VPAASIAVMSSSPSSSTSEIVRADAPSERMFAGRIVERSSSLPVPSPRRKAMPFAPAPEPTTRSSQPSLS